MKDVKRNDPKTLYLKELQRIFVRQKSARNLEGFLEDFFSPAEIRRFVERWRIAELLSQGRSQRDVKKKLGVSISKVSRCAYVLRYGNGTFSSSVHSS